MLYPGLSGLVYLPDLSRVVASLQLEPDAMYALRKTRRDEEDEADEADEEDDADEEDEEDEADE